MQVPNVQVLYFIKFPGHRLLLNLACADLSIWRANVGLPPRCSPGTVLNLKLKLDLPGHVRVRSSGTRYSRT